MACRQTETSNAASDVEGQRINVMFLCDEWKSSKGGLSTFNREFAVNLAQIASDSIKIHCYVSQSDELCREDARQHGVNLITARSIPGSTDPLDWLKIPPPELSNPDIVIGHGRKFGTPAYFIVQTAKCKWVHFVHVFCEDLGKYKVAESASLDAIEENEKKHKSEIELCKAADLVVAVGSRLQQKYSRSLPNVKVEIITPGILEKFSDEAAQLVEHRSVVKNFSVFMFGRTSFEDRTLKGYDIIANAIGSLDPKMFELTFVGAPSGEHTEIQQWFLDNTCIRRNQLTIRSYCNEQDKLKVMYHESDMVALPSRTEGFGLVALEAISAGVPVLVAGKSGIAEALQEVEGGKSVTVESDDAGEWAQRIQQLSNQSPEERQYSAKLLKENYSKTYSWSNECERFKRMIQDLVETSNALKMKIDVESMKPAEHITQNRTPASETESEGSPQLSHQGGSAVPVRADILQAPNAILTENELFRLIAANYLLTTPPMCEEDRVNFLTYLKEMRVVLTGVDTGSLLITVKCDSLDALERLWEDYLFGHLGEVVQKCFVTEEILMRLNLTELKLKTTILEEEYEAYKVYFEKESARGHFEYVAPAGEKPTHFTDEKVLTETDKDDWVSGQESFPVKQLREAMDDEELRRFFAVHVKEGAWQVVMLFLDELLHRQRVSTSKILPDPPSVSTAEGESRGANEDVQSRALIWWPTDKDQDLAVLCKLLTESDSKLDSLSLRDIEISDAGVKHLAEALTHSDCKLTSLSLNYITDKGVEHLCKALIHSDCELNNLDLSRNDEITEQGVKHLAEALNDSSCKLDRLNLSRNKGITDEGIERLSKTFSNSKCKLSSLNLFGNYKITDEGIKYLCRSLSTSNNCKLSSLVLGGNNSITDEGIKYLSKALSDSNCTLSSLDLSRNIAITDEGVKHLAEALINSNCELRYLNLSYNVVTDEGVEYLSEALADRNCKLDSLNLSRIIVTDKGLQHLAEALTSNCGLSRLNLSGNYAITDEGVRYLAEALIHSNYELSSLNVFHIEVITK